MVKAGIVQTGNYNSNHEAIKSISKYLIALGKKEADLVCLPEQWLKENKVLDYEKEFASFIQIAQDFSMTIIPGAFYEKNKKGFSISAPIIGPKGEIIGKQEKIHPFDYEKNLILPGKEAKIFSTSCKFGVIICYDMVFPKVANTLVKKGAQLLISPSRIIKRGINPWKMYTQVRSLENRVPILAANVNNRKFGGNSLIIDLKENNNVVLPNVIELKGENAYLKKFDLSKYEHIRNSRFLDTRKFR